MKINKTKIIFLFFLFFTLLITITLYFLKNISKQSKATPSPVLDTQEISTDSYFKQTDSVSDFFLYKEEGALYQSQNNGETAILEFLQKNPSFSPDVQGAFTADQTTMMTKKLFPENFLNNSYLIRKSVDRQERFLLSQNPSLTGEHFFYQQTINQLPVFGAVLAIHLKNSREIYALDGNLVFDQQIADRKIDLNEARTIALNKAYKEINNSFSLKIDEEKELIFNKKLIGISDEETNHPALMVVISSENEPLVFAKRYFISLFTAEVLFSESLIKSALNRLIYNCAGGLTMCPLARREGGPAVSDVEVNNAYDNLGIVYNYYRNTFGRDSYDGRGAQILAFVNLTTQIRCPNAAWTGEEMIFCTGMAVNDIVAHEFTHAVTMNTANLIYKDQSGALDESFADIFSFALDPDDWTIGEDSTAGILRYLNNPPQHPRLPQPDRLFSPHYYCGTQDEGGVHINNGVLNKAFYLMTVGGNFNGCQINGVGKEKTLAIAYRTLTSYLRPTANFRTVFNAFNSSCSDLYNGDSIICETVRSALQATEMDQQPENQQKGASCLGVTRVPPRCAIISPTQTNTPGPATVTPSSPSPSPTPIDNFQLQFKLRFQGILKQPPTDFNQLMVKTTLISQDKTIVVSKTTPFIADKSGFWYGQVNFANLSSSAKYTVLIKGPKHIQKKICHQKPNETFPGTYQCQKGEIELHEGINFLDFSQIYLLIGDFPDQDGIVNAYDLSLVRNNLNQTDPDRLRLADVNLDGIVDSQDYSLVIAALSIRVDEE